MAARGTLRAAGRAPPALSAPAPWWNASRLARPPERGRLASHPAARRAAPPRRQPPRLRQVGRVPLVHRHHARRGSGRARRAVARPGRRPPRSHRRPRERRDPRLGGQRPCAGIGNQGDLAPLLGGHLRQQPERHRTGGGLGAARGDEDDPTRIGLAQPTDHGGHLVVGLQVEELGAVSHRRYSCKRARPAASRGPSRSTGNPGSAPGGPAPWA